MKLSQLLLREDFYTILNKTLVQNKFFEKKHLSDNTVEFNCFKYLNIIQNDALHDRVTKALIFEYSLSKSRLKKYLQNIYIKLVFFPLISDYFIDSKIKLPVELINYAIVPGNHRLRLFDSSLNKIIVLLKSEERKKFLLNDIKARFNNKISYAPKILSYGDDWLIEEFIEGVPYNRIKNNLNNPLEIALKHNIELIEKNKIEVSKDKYIDDNLKEFHKLIEMVVNINLKKLISELNDLLVKKIKNSLNKKIEISITHGDFQEGNMRVNSNNEVYILDWESSDVRFYMYDFYVLFSGIRTGNSINKSFELFTDKLKNFKIFKKQSLSNLNKILLCYEELRFNLNEKISINFYDPGKDLMRLVTEINDFISQLDE